MNTARQLLNMLEDEQPPANPTPEAKPNTNFPNKPEVDKAIHKVAGDIAFKIDDELNAKIHDAMKADPVLGKLVDDDQMMAANDIKLHLVKMITV